MPFVRGQFFASMVEYCSKEVDAIPTLEDILYIFLDTLGAHAVLVIFLFAVMNERGWQRLKKLPALLLSPLTAAFLDLSLQAALSDAWIICYCISSCAILLICTLWVRWVWRIGSWHAFAAVCMAGIFQVAASCLSILFTKIPLNGVLQLVVEYAAVLAAAALLYRLRFGVWFRLLLENESGQRWSALLLFALEAAMEAFFILQRGIQPEYLAAYYLLVITMAALTAGLVAYLARQFDAARKMEAQRDVIAQQQFYERDLDDIRREVRAFRHDYKNLLAGLSEQADEGELDELRATLSKLDVGFERRIGEKIRSSTQIGNLRIPQARSLLLSKLAYMGSKGIDCRLEVLYPIEWVNMDIWDFTRCMGILLDNAAEAAAATEPSWVEIVLLTQGEQMSLRVSNPYTGTIVPDKIWLEGFSTKGKGRGLGLASYQKILTGYANVTSFTSWADGVFVQELTIGGPP